MPLVYAITSIIAAVALSVGYGHLVSTYCTGLRFHQALGIVIGLDLLTHILVMVALAAALPSF